MNNEFRPSVTVKTERGHDIVDELGMRPMQRRAYEQRGEQYLLVKSPPASGKSRAVMFIALDKMESQGVSRTIIAVPQTVIGGSFASRDLKSFGFHSDWVVDPRWNLCGETGEENEDMVRGSTVDAIGEFLKVGSGPLICTHAALMLAFDRYGVEAFDGCFMVVDEFHHVSSEPQKSADPNVGMKQGNRLGTWLRELIDRGNTHIAALTGSYFRGDGEAILAPDYEMKFAVVTYTYHEQLCDYKHLKRLDIGHRFYRGSYLENIKGVLDPTLKTIVHIPHTNSRESTGDPGNEAGKIMDFLGTYESKDRKTGFHLLRTRDCRRLLKVADLVNLPREDVLISLRSPACTENRDHVDIIIALNMAQEGFDWVWCEHALTIGYRASLTQIVQIIGRATRDAEGKEVARFTNMIAEPNISDMDRNEGVNDILKAIGASLLMEHVMAPKVEFLDKESEGSPREGYDYGPGGYKKDKSNVGVPKDPRKTIQIEVNGLGATTPSQKRKIENYVDDILPDIIGENGFAFMKHSLGSALAGDSNKEAMEEVMDVRLRKIVRNRCADLDEDEQEMAHKLLMAKVNLTGIGTKGVMDDELALDDPNIPSRSAFAKGIRQWALRVGDINVDLIKGINPLSRGCEVLSKAFDKDNLQQLDTAIRAFREKITDDDVYELGKHAIKFKEKHKRLPDKNSSNPLERRMATAIHMLQTLEKFK